MASTMGETGYTQAQTPSEGANGASFLPDFCNARVIFAVVLATQLLAFILTLAAGEPNRDPLIQLALISLFVQWIALGNVAALCWLRDWLNRFDPAFIIIGSYGLSLLVTLVFSLLTLWFVPIELTPAYGYEAGEYFLFRNLAISAVLSAIALRYFYMQNQWKRNLETESRSRIQALQARIRPHFLFNSMNTIASLTRTNPERAEKAVEDLADLFRVSLKEQDNVRLADELDITRRYIAIEQLRLGDRLKVEWQIDEDLPEDAPVPALILQPLVENAIYHGIEPHTAGGTVNLSILNGRDELRFAVSNPLLKTRSRRSGNQMAQDNIRQRLQLVYGEAGRMHINQTENRYSVTFSIPLEQTS